MAMSDLPVPTPQPGPEPSGPQQMRASDADRDKYAAVLREAYAEGRLDATEYEERLASVYTARTYGELAPVLRDLPVPPGAVPGAPHLHPGAAPFLGAPPAGSAAAVVPGGAWGIEVAAPGTAAPGEPSAVAVFGGVERKGRWVVPAESDAVAVFGGVQLDLTHAVLEAPEVLIRCVAVFGGVEIVVPHGVEVRMEGGIALFGGRSGPDDSVPVAPGGPVVRVEGYAFFGGVDVKRAKVPPLPPGVRPLPRG